MNKKIMSFVLAMFLSVGLGVGNLLAADNYNAHSGDGANTSVLQSSGAAKSTNPSASSLTDRICQAFHYEDGILVSATGPDGTITVYDQGQFRGTMAMGMDGNYTWSSLMFYGSDYDAIAEKGLKQFLLDCGVKPEQLTGGGEEEIDLTLTSQAYDQLSAEDKKLCEKDNGTYYEYKTKVDDQEVTKLLSEDEYKALSDEEKKNCKKYEGTVYKYKKPATEPQEVGWLQRVQNHLGKGPNYSVQINFGANQGAAVTLCVDGKAMETYAWNDALIQYVEYNKNGFNTFSLQKGVDLKESVETGKPQTEDKWVCEVTVNGKVQGQYDVIPNADGSAGFTLKEPSTMQYTYNADGTRASIYNAENGQTTYFSANKVMSVSGPLKDKNGNTITNEDGSPQIVTLALYRYTDNGMYDTVTSFGNDGGVTTTVYFNNKAMGTYRGGPELAGLMRSQILDIWETALSNKEYKGTYDIDSRLINVSWYPEQLKQIQANGDVGIKNFMKVSGLDYDNADAYKSVVGGNDENGVYQMGLIEKALKYTNWLSQALSMTYYDTAYSQDELDEAEKKATGENKAKVKDIPANKYVGSATVFNKGVQLAAYDFSNLDPSVSRAYYIFFTDTFNTGSQEFKDMMEQLGITFSPTMSQREFEEAIDKIVDYICDLIDNASITESSSGNTQTWTADLSTVQKIFKKGKIGNFSATLETKYQTQNGGTNATDGGTNATHSHNRASTTVSKTTSTSSSTTTTGDTAEDAKKGLRNALNDLKTTIQKFFASASAKIKSGNFDNLMDSLGQVISEGYSGKFTKTVTTTYTTTITSHTDIDLDPAVVGDVEKIVIFNADGDEISYDDYLKLSDDEKAKCKRYAVLTNCSVDIGTGFQSESDYTSDDGDDYKQYEKIYVEIDDSTCVEMQDRLSRDEKVAYAAAGYIGKTNVDGYITLVETYASSISSDVEELKTQFENDLKNNDTFQTNMAKNRDSFAQLAGYDSWEAAEQALGEGGIFVDWKLGWDIIKSDDASSRYKFDSESGKIVPIF